MKLSRKEISKLLSQKLDEFQDILSRYYEEDEASQDNILYECDKCNAVFEDIIDLKNHLFKHLDDRWRAKFEGESDMTDIGIVNYKLTRMETDLQKVKVELIKDEYVSDPVDKSELDPGTNDPDEEDPVQVKVEPIEDEDDSGPVVETVQYTESNVLDQRENDVDPEEDEPIQVKNEPIEDDYDLKETEIDPNEEHPEANVPDLGQDNPVHINIEPDFPMNKGKLRRLHQIKNARKRKPRKSRQKFNCDECNLVFKKEYDYKVHNVVHIGSISIQCEVCNHEAKTYQQWYYHKNVLHIKSECQKCGKHVTNLQKHMNLIHLNPDYYPESCNHCDKRFKSKGNLNVHEETHDSSKKFQCEKCDKFFKSKASLRNHDKQMHLDKCHLKCEVCGKAFSSARRFAFLEHLNLHTGERPHGCDECGRHFYAKELLKKHQKSCSNKIEYNCKECGKNFLKDYFRKHVMAKHCDLNAYRCHVCENVGFNHSDAYKRHMKTQHPNEKYSLKIKEEHMAIVDLLCEELKQDGKLNNNNPKNISYARIHADRLMK